MIKNLKTLLALGVVTITTAGSIIPVNALCNTTTNKKCYSKGTVYLCVNGKKYKFDINSNCINKPILPDVENNNNNNTDSNNNTGSSDSNNSNTGSSNNQDSSKPNDNTNNSGNNDSSSSKPENNTNQDNNSTTSKPENDTNNSGNNSESNSNSFASYQQEVVDLVNKERAKYGLSALKSNAYLANVATIKSQDMINKNYFSHTSPTYGSPFDMMKQFGISYSTAGENIAMGQKTPSEVVTAWMNSEGHRANILNSNFKEIGIGVAKNAKGQLYWTQMFIG